MGDFHIGLSLGQMGNTSALAIGERIEGDALGCHVRHLERFDAGTPYPKIIDRLGELLAENSPLLEAGIGALVIDATAAGRPVFNLFDQARKDNRLPVSNLYHVSITAFSHKSSAGTSHPRSVYLP